MPSELEDLLQLMSTRRRISLSIILSPPLQRRMSAAYVLHLQSMCSCYAGV